MELYGEELPPGSELIRGISGGYGQGPLELMLVFIPRGAGIVEAAGAFGHLDHETIIKIGMRAIEKGYRILQLQVRKGAPVTDLLTLAWSDRTFDYYTVDLIATAERLGIQA
jgi:hypothetical protein